MKEAFIFGGGGGVVIACITSIEKNSMSNYLEETKQVGWGVLLPHHDLWSTLQLLYKDQRGHQ